MGQDLHSSGSNTQTEGKKTASCATAEATSGGWREQPDHRQRQDSRSKIQVRLSKEREGGEVGDGDSGEMDPCQHFDCVPIADKVDSTQKSSDRHELRSGAAENPTDNQATNLRCFYTNANSLKGKMHELRQRIGKDTYDIVGITETWFTPEIRDAELTLEGFDIFRVDRQNESYERGGGVVLYINKELKASELEKISTAKFEDMVWCRMNMKDGNLLVGVCYRSTSSDEANNNKLTQVLEDATRNTRATRVLIMGDFNYPTIDYISDIVNAGHDTDAYRFFDTTNDLFLTQHVKEVTRI